MCLSACPYGAPQFNDEKRTNYFPGVEPIVDRPLEAHQKHVAGKAEHCTLCTHRLAKGEKPACVAYCATGALTLVDYDKLSGVEKAKLEKSRMMTALAGTKPKVRYHSRCVDFAEVKTK